MCYFPLKLFIIKIYFFHCFYVLKVLPYPQINVHPNVFLNILCSLFTCHVHVMNVIHFDVCAIRLTFMKELADFTLYVFSRDVSFLCNHLHSSIYWGSIYQFPSIDTCVFLISLSHGLGF